MRMHNLVQHPCPRFVRTVPLASGLAPGPGIPGPDAAERRRGGTGSAPGFPPGDVPIGTLAALHGGRRPYPVLFRRAAQCGPARAEADRAASSASHTGFSRCVPGARLLFRKSGR